VTVGAWSFLSNFVADRGHRARDVLDSALRALDGFRVTSLAGHLTGIGTQ
jgi:hypothetical protein